MQEKLPKISRKIKEKKLEIAKIERKKRKKRKRELIIPKTRNIDLLLILKTNALPVSVLLIGTFLFHLSTYGNFGTPFDFERTDSPSSTNVSQIDYSTEEKANKFSKTNSVNSLNGKYEIKISSSELASFSPPTIINIASASSSAVFNTIAPSIKKQDRKVKNKEPEKKLAKISLVQAPVKRIKKNYEVAFASKDPYENVSDLRVAIAKLIKNTPMEAMLDDIIKRNRAVTAFLVGIGMKESKYGIYSPKKNGAECFNYWGYRGKENTTASGYSCFSSPSHAVQVVGDRIEKLVNSGLDSPAEMIVWKCGSTCAGHSEESVDKWIADVSINYYRLNPRLLSRK